MLDVVFTGNFLKPVEAFVRQNFDASDLNRLSPDVLYWAIGITLVGLFVHLVFLYWAKKERK